MEHLNSLDRLLLRIEQPHHPIDLIMTWVLEPTDRGPLPFETVREFLTERVGRLPVLTHRLVRQPFGVADERWAPDPDFHIDRHLSLVTTDEPMAFPQLAELMVAVSDGAPLHRDRPLWQMWYVQELHDGGSALVLRHHHALMDGVASVEMADDLFDHDPVPFVPRDQIEQAGRAHPHLIERAAWLVPDLIGRGVNTASSTLRLSKTAVRGGWMLLQGVPGRPPRTTLNQHVTSTDRVTAFRSLSLGDVRLVRTAFPGASINDVLVAVIAGALRRFLAGREAIPKTPLTAAMPVNIRRGDEPRASGNYFTYGYASVPIHLQDRSERLGEVRDRSRVEKRRMARVAAEGGTVEVEGPNIFPSALWGPMGSFLASPVFDLVPPVVNLSISTVPGPKRPWFLAGVRVRHLYNRVPTLPPIQLFFHSFSYLDHLELGLTAYRETVPDAEALIDFVAQELSAYVELAKTRTAERPDD